MDEDANIKEAEQERNAQVKQFENRVTEEQSRMRYDLREADNLKQTNQRKAIADMAQVRRLPLGGNSPCHSLLGICDHHAREGSCLLSLLSASQILLLLLALLLPPLLPALLGSSPCSLSVQSGATFCPCRR
eukprot:COSAG05_NODE_3097_length_2324_cov_31.462237_2_plen_132_part_00